MSECRLVRALFLILLVGLAGCSRKRTEADFLESGKKLFQKQDYARALLEFKNAAQLKPGDAEPFYQAGLAYLKMGKYREAATSLKKAADLNPKHAAAQLQLAQLGVAFGNQEMLGVANQRVEAVLKDTPDNPTALNLLALSELRLGQKEEAQKHLEEAVEKFPQNLKVAANLASIKLAQRDFKGAEAVLQKALAQAPKSTQPLIVLGGLYMQMKNFSEAEKQYLRVLELDPKHEVALFDLASVQDLKEEKDQAEQTYKRLAALAGKYKHVYGVYLYQEGKRDAAIAEFEKLVRQDRRDVTNRTRLIVAYLNAGRLPEVEKLLAAALKDNPKDVVALVERSEIEIGKGQLDQAQIDIESVLKFQSDSAEAHYILSAIHHARGAELSRRDELARAVRLQPSMLQARLELAQCYIAQKQPKAALDALDAAAPSQQQTVGAIVQRNWALAELQDWVALRKGIDQGLALARTVDLLLQDGMLRMQQADYAGARKSFEEGLKQSPEDVRLLKAMAGTWVAQKQPAMALAAIREYASQRPKSAGLQYFLGEWLLASNSPEQARTAFRAAKAADPGFIQADLAMARVDSSTGNDAASRRELMELLAKRGEDARVRLMLGAIEESANNTTEAIAHYRKALETDPKNLMALNNLAFLLTGIGDLDEALQLAQKATEIAPAEPVVEDTLGWAMYCKGMYRAAIPHLESAFSKQAIPRTQYHLAMAYVRVGRDQQARQAYVAAMKADPNLPEAKMAATVIASGARF